MSPLFEGEEHPAHEPLADGWPDARDAQKAIATGAIVVMLAPLCPAIEEHEPHGLEREYVQVQVPALEFYVSASSMTRDVTVPLTGVHATAYVGTLTPFILK